VAEKDEEGVEDHEDDAEGAEPESILRHFPRREPPSAAELRELKSKLRGSYDAYARLVSLEIGQHAIGPESRRHLHQDVLTQFWALVKEHGVPFDLCEALGAIAWGMLKNYRRRRARAAAYVRASRAEPTEAGRASRRTALGGEPAGKAHAQRFAMWTAEPRAPPHAPSPARARCAWLREGAGRAARDEPHIR
jgi:hypothetical protein